MLFLIGPGSLTTPVNNLSSLLQNQGALSTQTTYSQLSNDSRNQWSILWVLDIDPNLLSNEESHFLTTFTNLQIIFIFFINGSNFFVDQSTPI